MHFSIIRYFMPQASVDMIYSALSSGQALSRVQTLQIALLIRWTNLLLLLIFFFFLFSGKSHGL